MGTFKIIPKEVKEQILHRVKVDGISVPQVAKEHGISDKTIYTWLKKDISNTVSFSEYNYYRNKTKLLYELVGKLTFELERRTFKKN